MRTIIRIPIDNGRVPVGHYSGADLFVPPSTVHSSRAEDRDPTAHSSLCIGLCEDYYSVSLV